MILAGICSRNAGRNEIGRVAWEDSYDVIVVGLGTAGSIAAWCSARSGLRVLALEKSHCMGGVGTGGCVLGYYYGATGGAFEEIDAQVYRMNENGFTPMDAGHRDFIHPDIKSMVLEQRARKAGAEIRYEASIFGVYMEGNQVLGLQWKDSRGIHRTGAQYVIDCTGEAEICGLVGCETRRGRSMDGHGQPYSFCTLSVREGAVHSYYVDNGYVNANDGEEFSAKVLETYTQSMFWRKHVIPEDYYSVIASQVGLREGRTIIGEENIAFDDFLQDKVSVRPLFYAYSNMDTHSREHAFESRSYIRWSLVSRLRKLNFFVPVPQGALIPKGYKGILAAGRCIAVDHDISPSVRMKRDMQKCGEAAAALACLSIRSGLDAGDVPYEELAVMLRKTGCLDDANQLMTYRSVEYGTGRRSNTPVHWLTDKQEICRELKQDEPGIGIWSTLRLGMDMAASLREWLQADCRNLRIHSAFALAMLGDDASLDVLRDVVKSRRGFVRQEDPLERYHDLSAIYLLGEWGDEQSIHFFMKIMEDSNHVVKKGNGNDVYTQYFTYCLMALVNIYHNSHSGSVQRAIAAFFTKLAGDLADFQFALNEQEGLFYSVHHRIWFVLTTIIEETDDHSRGEN